MKKLQNIISPQGNTDQKHNEVLSQTKSTIRYYLTHSSCYYQKDKKKMQLLAKIWTKGNIYILFVRLESSKAIMENNMKVP